MTAKARLLSFPDDAEVMTGFEYAAASQAARAGMVDQVVPRYRRRYDGEHASSPWDEAECGHHYWPRPHLLIALSGFDASPRRSPLRPTSPAPERASASVRRLRLGHIQPPTISALTSSCFEILELNSEQSQQTYSYLSQLNPLVIALLPFLLLAQASNPILPSGASRPHTSTTSPTPPPATSASAAPRHLPASPRPNPFNWIDDDPARCRTRGTPSRLSGPDGPRWYLYYTAGPKPCFAQPPRK